MDVEEEGEGKQILREEWGEDGDRELVSEEIRTKVACLVRSSSKLRTKHSERVETAVATKTSHSTWPSSKSWVFDSRILLPAQMVLHRRNLLFPTVRK